MRSALLVTGVTFTAAEPHLRTTGVVGWAAFDVNGQLRIEVTVRTTRDGRHVLVFPSRRTRGGERRSTVNPKGADARRELEEQVFTALRKQGALR